MTDISSDPAAAASFVREQLPSGGLFQDQDWRVAPRPFPISPSLFRELESLGRVLLQFYKAINLLYRQSVAEKQPTWVARLFDQGKPATLIDYQRAPAFKNEVPRVIRPDLLLTEEGFSITELDSVPGGIGLTAWLNRTYARLNPSKAAALIGGERGMLEGFQGIFGGAPSVHLMVSEESASYRPEMEWLAAQLPDAGMQVRRGDFRDWKDGDAVYRFFELFDLANVPASHDLIQAALDQKVSLTAPIKPCLEEKLSLALLWNRNLRPFWHQQLGAGFLNRLLQHVPQSWVIDPEPLPPHAAYPSLDLTDWNQLKGLSQRERDLILKVSGFSAEAWGARGVYLGSDLSQAEWSEAVDRALSGFASSPCVLQRYHKPKSVPFSYYDFAAKAEVSMASRVRLCPYYFVVGEGDAARARLAGVLATACPADKKIIHGMKDAILAPCEVSGS